MVRQEVHYCVSSLVATLAAGYGLSFEQPRGALKNVVGSLRDVCEQAFELASPIDDWEEAATQEGWRFDGRRWFHAPPGRAVCKAATYDTAQECCEANSIDPYQREIFEHWIVSDWLADKLAAKGERVEKDFAGLTVWGRTTTGQGIASDGLIERIFAESQTS